MFDKLVESTSTGADVKPRRRIFAATLVLVATLFATAVVASIYAADYDLGASNFDIAELLTPVTETEPPAPEPEPQQRRSNLPQSTNNQIVRQILMASTSDPTKVPDKISTAVNPYLSTDPSKYDRVTIGDRPSDPGINGNAPIGSGIGSPSYAPGSSDDGTVKEPPPPVKPPERKLPPKSLGVITGKASHLPKPPYPQTAKAVGAAGAVNVQVTIDESGNVISAKAVSGHVMLRQVSEEAARRAKFSPTTLSEVPVKVTGIIVYNFTRN